MIQSRSPVTIGRVNRRERSCARWTNDGVACTKHKSEKCVSISGHKSFDITFSWAKSNDKCECTTASRSSIPCVGRSVDIARAHLPFGEIHLYVLPFGRPRRRQTVFILELFFILFVLGTLWMPQQTILLFPQWRPARVSRSPKTTAKLMNVCVCMRVLRARSLCHRQRLIWIFMHNYVDTYYCVSFRLFLFEIAVFTSTHADWSLVAIMLYGLCAAFRFRTKLIGENNHVRRISHLAHHEKDTHGAEGTRKKNRKIIAWHSNVSRVNGEESSECGANQHKCRVFTYKVHIVRTWNGRKTKPGRNDGILKLVWWESPFLIKKTWLLCECI